MLTTEELLERRIVELKELDENVSKASEKLRQSRQDAEKFWNEANNRRIQSFTPGQLVLKSAVIALHASGMKVPKFTVHWEGPYFISKAYGNGSYELAELDGTTLRSSIHGSQLKAFFNRVWEELW